MGMMASALQPKKKQGITSLGSGLLKTSTAPMATTPTPSTSAASNPPPPQNQPPLAASQTLQGATTNPFNVQAPSVKSGQGATTGTPPADEFGMPTGPADSPKSFGATGSVFEWINHLRSLGYDPSVAENMSKMPGYEDIFGGVTDTAQKQLLDSIVQGGYRPGENEFTDYLLNSLTGGGPIDWQSIMPSLETAAGPSDQIQMADAGGQNLDFTTNYDVGMGDTGTQTGQYDVSGFPGNIASALEEIQKTSGVDLSQIPGFQNLLTQLGQSGPAGFTGSGAQGNAQIQDFLSSAGNMFKSGAAELDTEALRNKLNAEEQAVLSNINRTSAEAAAARGYGSQSAVGQGVLAEQLAPAMAEMSRRREESILGAEESSRARQLQAGQGLGTLGGEMTSALQRESEARNAHAIDAFTAQAGALGEAGAQNLEARRQDISAAIDAYESETGRKAMVGDAVSADATNYINSYLASTERTQGERKMSQGDVQNALTAYQSATERGEVDQAGKEAAAQLGFDYDSLSADNQNRFNEVMADIYRTGGQITADQNAVLADIFGTQVGAETDIYGTKIKAGTDMAGITEEAGQEAGRQNLDLISMLGDLLLGEGGLQAEGNQQMLQALMADKEGFIDFMNAILGFKKE